MSLKRVTAWDSDDQSRSDVAGRGAENVERGDAVLAFARDRAGDAAVGQTTRPGSGVQVAQPR